MGAGTGNGRDGRVPPTGRRLVAWLSPRGPQHRARRTGRPPRGGVRRVCGKPPGRSRTRRTGRPKSRRYRAGTTAAKEILGVPGCIKVCAGGTVGKEHALPREVSYGPAPTGVGYLGV